MDIGKLLITFGLVIVLIGIVFSFFGGISGIPRLPGDIYIKRDNFTIYFPLVTSLLLSVVITIVMQFFFKK